MEGVRCQLNLGEAKEMLWREISKGENNVFRYIYLFGFDNEDKLVWGDVILPDDHPNAFERIMSWADLFNDDKDDLYFMIKVKEFDFADMRQRDEAYIEGFIDMRGTMERVKGFIEAWKGFEEREGGDDPALKRYTVEFVNHRLGLPFKYSEKQQILDMSELQKSETAYKKG